MPIARSITPPPHKSGVSEDDKIIGLSILQCGGAVAVLILYSICYLTNNIRKPWLFGRIMIAAIIFAFILSLVVFLTTHSLQRLWLASFNKTFNVNIPSGDYSKTLPSIVNLFVAVDVPILALCVYSTGGSHASVFVPFLFIIPPILVLLDAIRTRYVFYYAGLTIAVFCFGLYPQVVEFYFPSANTYREPLLWHSLLLALSTALCTCMPLVLTLAPKLAKRGSAREANTVE